MTRMTVALRQFGWALSHWWDREDQFDWFTTYLADRQLIEPARIVIALSSGGATLIPVVYLFDSSAHAPWTALGVVGIVTGVSGALMWLFLPWPSVRRSRWWVIVCDVAILLGALAEANAIGGVYGCCVFGLIGGYIAFFHGARMLATHLAFALASAAAVSTFTVVQDQQSAAHAVIGVIQAVLVTIGVPAVTQFLLEALASEAAASEIDTLTGLLNRRGLDRALERMTAIAGHGSPGLALVVADLDNFKEINDRFGHRHGDHVLAAIAVRLRTVVGVSGVVSRVGGDEFVIADSARWTDPDRLASSVLNTIAGVSDPPVTASVGVVYVRGRAPWTRLHGTRLHGTRLHGTRSHGTPSYGVRTASTVAVTDLADAAMYEAKRAGGNTVRTRDHRGW